MIDRISRDFVYYSDYRRQLNSRVAPNEAYEVRQNIDMVDVFGRSRMLEVSPYPRQSLESALVRASDEADRIHALYTKPSLGYSSSQLDLHTLSYLGQNIDLVG